MVLPKRMYFPPLNVKTKKLKRYALAHSNGVEYADTIEALNFAAVDPFAVWSVFADYGEHQVRIGQVWPVSACDGDAAYAIGAGWQATAHYVNGAAFVPGAVRNRLVGLASLGEFECYAATLPCVTASSAVAPNRLASPFKPA